nr:WPE palindromic element domain-containing protein [Wolbachia endosymbiont of Laodelphax striatellus]
MIQETKKDVIPVPRHWDPENFTLNEHTRWLYNRNWIPVSSTDHLLLKLPANCNVRTPKRGILL